MQLQCFARLCTARVRRNDRAAAMGFWGGMGQRIDALVELRFDPDRDPQKGRHHPGIIPWYDGFARSGRQ
jgi:hypothetical protein